jgi:hypothetical protein
MFNFHLPFAFPSPTWNFDPQLCEYLAIANTTAKMEVGGSSKPSKDTREKEVQIIAEPASASPESLLATLDLQDQELWAGTQPPVFNKLSRGF